MHICKPYQDKQNCSLIEARRIDLWRSISFTCCSNWSYLQNEIRFLMVLSSHAFNILKYRRPTMSQKPVPAANHSHCEDILPPPSTASNEHFIWCHLQPWLLVLLLCTSENTLAPTVFTLISLGHG